MVKIKSTKCTKKRWLIAEIIDAWKMTQDELVRNPELADEKRHTGQNIYTGASVRVKDFIKRFRWIHFGFKYKVLVPILLIVERIIGDKLEGNVPPEIYNTNLQVFDQSWEETIDIWATQYLSFKEGPQNVRDNPVYKEQLEYARHGSGGARSLRTIKEVGLTVALNDTAYREFLNILMFRIAHNMSNAYRGKDPIEHVFYTSKNISDVHYFHVMQAKAQAEAQGQTMSQVMRTNSPQWFNERWDTASENKALDEMSNYFMNAQWDQVWNPKWHHFRDQVWTHQWQQIMKQECPANDPLWEQAWTHMGNQVNAQLWAQIWAECARANQAEIKEKVLKNASIEARRLIRDNARDVSLHLMAKELKKEVPSAIESMKWEPLWDNAWLKLRNQVRDAATEYYDNKLKQQAQIKPLTPIPDPTNTTNATSEISISNGKEVSQQ